MTINVIEHAVDDPSWSAEQQEDFLPRVLLTLDRARRELRVPPGDNDLDQNNLIRELITSAASFVAEDLNIPLIQESVYLLIEHSSSDLPITIDDPTDEFALAASKVRYQLPSVDYTIGDWPEELEISESDQVAPCSGAGDLISGNIVVKPPGGTWPQAAQNHYVLHYERGLKAENRDVDLYRQLCILKLRDLFFAVSYMKGTKSNSAYSRLASNVRFLGLLPNFKRIS